MKRTTTLSFNGAIYDDFVNLVGKGHVSRFCEEKMQEYNRFMAMRYNVICHKCGQKTHIRVALTNGGKCQWESCQAIILEEIKMNGDTK